MVKALKQDGFDVILVRDQKPVPSADGKTDDYSDVHVDADAILSVWTASFGYVSPPNSTHYEPSGVVRVRMLDAKTKADIYFKTFVIGWKLPMKQSVYLETDERYRYKSIDAFVSSRGWRALRGLLEAESLVAQRVQADLAAQPPAAASTGTGTAQQ